MHAHMDSRPAGHGLTLIEILVSVTILAVLAGMLVPGIAMVRERVRRVQADERVAEIHMAMQHYAAEDRRHRFPPQTAPGDHSLRLDPDDVVPGNLNLLRQGGYEIDTSGLLQEGAPPFAALDPWKRPYQYLLDDQLDLPGVQRPLPLGACPEWNVAGTRPWGYVWSGGAKATADGSGWIYRRDGR